MLPAMQANRLTLNPIKKAQITEWAMDKVARGSEVTLLLQVTAVQTSLLTPSINLWAEMRSRDQASM